MICPACQGKKHVHVEECKKCDGLGEIECPECDGIGSCTCFCKHDEEIEHPCYRCDGKGQIPCTNGSLLDHEAHDEDCEACRGTGEVSPFDSRFREKSQLVLA